MLARTHNQKSSLSGKRMPSFSRNRLAYAVAVVAVIALGLASRRFPGLFPSALGKYPGDALWAIMVFLIWAVALPRLPTLSLGLGALVTAFADEFSQLYQAPWINAIRQTTPGHLVLGSTFSRLDLIAYTLGIALCVLCERLVLRSSSGSPASRR